MKGKAALKVLEALSMLPCQGLSNHIGAHITYEYGGALARPTPSQPVKMKKVWLALAV